MPRLRNEFDFDVFVSHASEDKAIFVTPLANELKKHGLRVWFDKFTLKVGDNLHQSIEKGLARSRFGVVVFSPRFLAKNWPKAELDGLFTRELDGHKVILPVWHKVSSARMKKELPILANKVALRSSDGIESVARSLVEIIRPELLELDQKKDSAFQAGDAFLTEARMKHPGYGFAIQVGSLTDSEAVEAPFALMNPHRRIEISIADKALIEKPLGGHVEFFGGGVDKALEFLRTGKPQRWATGEFRLTNWNVPLMSRNPEADTFDVGPINSSLNPPRHMRVEVGSRSPVVFPLMEMRPTRGGTDEAEFLLSDKEAALSISVVLSMQPDSRTISPDVKISLSWETRGKRVNECKKMLDTIEALRRRRTLRVIDISLEKVIFEMNEIASNRPNPVSDNLRRTVLLAVQIEKEFSVTLRMPERISKEDEESLFHLDCLLNGSAYADVGDTQLNLIKAEGEVGAVQEAFIKGEVFATFIDAPSDYPGYFPLFGEQIKASSWVRIVEFRPIILSEAISESFSSAPAGTSFSIGITAKGPGGLRWRKDSDLSHVQISNLAQSL